MTSPANFLSEYWGSHCRTCKPRCECSIQREKKGGRDGTDRDVVSRFHAQDLPLRLVVLWLFSLLGDECRPRQPLRQGRDRDLLSTLRRAVGRRRSTERPRGLFGAVRCLCSEHGHRARLALLGVGEERTAFRRRSGCGCGCSVARRRASPRSTSHWCYYILPSASQLVLWQSRCRNVRAPSPGVTESSCRVGPVSLRGRRRRAGKPFASACCLSTVRPVSCSAYSERFCLFRDSALTATWHVICASGGNPNSVESDWPRRR